MIMKTLIFNGSPRIHGDSSSLIQLVTEKIDGEYRMVNAYRCDISPCVDCRYCWKNSGCAIKDEMQDVYQFIQECDNILIASLLYFFGADRKAAGCGKQAPNLFLRQVFQKGRTHCED